MNSKKNYTSINLCYIIAKTNNKFSNVVSALHVLLAYL